MVTTTEPIARATVEVPAVPSHHTEVRAPIEVGAERQEGEEASGWAGHLLQGRHGPPAL
jgi:hypothetical protein